ncbi:MAG: hypothetical protein LCH58_06725 [Bacteroidetes bacterium]|uniref:hypothetical protein n=1 Tax=Phnomibacter sp. TaxID=2836217 RepID=UPI002FDD51A6|nr:hypothetical protein [Bacteroidota bacterium]
MNRFFRWGWLPLLLLLAACSSYEAPESGIDCGRQFINATYQGNFKRAKQLLAPGGSNEELLNTRFEQPFRSLDGFGKERLSQSSIVIISIKTLSENEVQVTYQNAYDNQPKTLQCVQQGEQWLINLSFTFPQ